MRPVIGLTMGDPAGIGPEVVVQACMRHTTKHRTLLIGDFGVLEETVTRLSSPLVLYEWTVGDPLRPESRGIPVLNSSHLNPKDRVPGNPTAAGGNASYRYVQIGVHLALTKTLDGLVTAPICKSMWHAAGHHYPGHTELLAKMTRTPEVRMMLVGEQLRVILVTTHMALTRVAERLTIANIEKTIVLAANHLERFHGVNTPRLAVAGFNPHSGEGGAFGSEERLLVQPAIDKAVANGLAVTGPVSPDTVFVQAMRGEFDAVICHYHDQGLIPFKMVSWFDGVNVTVGLPIIRTSPDHGTAFDIAGQNKADDRSMHAAVALAAAMTERV